jgi:hypothetical protein
VFRRAASECPAHPEKFLRTVKSSIARLEQDEEFAGWRDTPWVFMRTAINPAHPEEFLRTVKTTVARLEQDEEFAGWRDMPWVFRHAAVYNPGAPEKLLRHAQSNLSLLQENDEFASIPSWLLKEFAVNGLKAEWQK